MPGLQDSANGIATSSLTNNIVYLGVDWRHWGNMNNVLRAVTDYIEKNQGRVVPVELIDFDAIALNNHVELSWSTASENNTDKFVVERSQLTQVGKTQFEPIAEEIASGKSNTTRSYGPIVDSKVGLGNTYVYRLKMIDKDGTADYSKEVEVSINSSLWLQDVCPNPLTSTTTINFVSDKSAYGTLSLYDINGNRVLELYNGVVNMGNNEVSLNPQQLATGSYTLLLTVDNKSISKTVHIVK